MDIHVHSSPDTVPRAQDDIELTRSAKAAGMAAIVLKNHHFPTADRALIAESVVGGIRVLGGVVLNGPSGGINSEAVRSALAVGGRVVWLPTISAANHREHLAQGAGGAHMRSLTSAGAVVEVLGANGRVLPELDDVLTLIAEADAVLATGHLSVPEIETVVPAALDAGVSRIVITHVEAPVVAMPLPARKDLARAGVVFEHCYLNVLAGGQDAAALIEDIRAVGLDSCVLSTDLGQAFNPPATEGFAAFHDRLAAAGLQETEWRTLACSNPARLLGLDLSKEMTWETSPA